MDNLDLFQHSDLLHTQERMRLYRPGGFHPVRLGDTFSDGRYKVHHKLGWGGFATVWLARDQGLKQWVALKIPTADTSAGSESRELETLHRLRRVRASHRIARLLDSFAHDGPNGRHQCLVFELLGPTVDHVVSDYHDGGERLEAAVVLRITRQLLQALVSIHKAGYAHGDVSGANLAFTARRLARLPLKAMLKVLGEPKFEPLVRLDGQPISPGLPEQLVETTKWVTWVDEDEEDARLVDLGEAFAHGKEPAKLAEPGALQAPERIFTGRFDYKVDLWRAGCTIYSLVIGARPFQYLGDVDVLVAQMIHFVEDLPPEWQPEWKRMKEQVGGKWNDIPDSMTGQSKLEERFERWVPEPSLQPLLRIIQGLMRFRPEDRISAEEALTLLDGSGQQAKNQ